MKDILRQSGLKTRPLRQDALFFHSPNPWHPIIRTCKHVSVCIRICLYMYTSYNFTYIHYPTIIYVIIHIYTNIYTFPPTAVDRCQLLIPLGSREATPKSCSAVNPKEPVPDVARGICRACIIYGCKTCTTEGADHRIRFFHAHDFFFVMFSLILNGDVCMQMYV